MVGIHHFGEEKTGRDMTEVYKIPKAVNQVNMKSNPKDKN